MNRVLRVAHVQLVNWQSVFGVPWLVLGSSFLINLLIYLAIGGHTKNNNETGGLSGAYLCLVVIHLTTVTQVFPFAVGLSVTRRAFYAATSLIVLTHSVVFGVCMTVLKAVESATDGWGVHMSFFRIPYVNEHNALLQAAVFTVPAIFLSYLGVVIGTVFRRWGQAGVVVLGVGTLLAAGFTTALILWMRWGRAVGSFFTSQHAAVLLAVYPLILAGLAAGCCYRLLVRAPI